MPTVGPITETHVRLVYDSDSNGLGGPLDMTGPDIGEVVYSQDAGDDLKVTIHLEFGWPGTTYQVFLVGGPSHALGTGYTTIGTLTTNAVGAGTATFLVPFAVLQNHPPYGPGYRTDHIDMLVRVGDESRGEEFNRPWSRRRFAQEGQSFTTPVSNVEKAAWVRAGSVALAP